MCDYLSWQTENEWMKYKIEKKYFLTSSVLCIFFFFSSLLFFPNMREAFSNRSERWALRSRCTYDDDDDSRVYISRSSYHSPKTAELSAKLTSHIIFCSFGRWTSLQRRTSARFDLDIYFSFVWPTTLLCPILWCSRILAVYFCLS